MHDAAAIRLLTVPWSALARLGGLLPPLVHEVVHGAPAERVLDKFLRGHRDLLAPERRVASEVLFGVGLWRRRLAWMLGAVDARAVDPRLLVLALASGMGGYDGALAASALGLRDQDVPAVFRPPPEAIEIRYSFPDWIADILRAEVGAEAPELADAFNLPGPVTFRANLRVHDRDALIAALATEGVLAEPGRFAPDAVVVRSDRPNVYGLEAYRLGAFEVQDEGSQLLGEIVGARPGERVLDFCAGAGGKSLLLAGKVGPSGEVHAFDINGERLGRLEARAVKAGLENVLVHRGEVPPGLLFDRVLVDAPCSELGALRRGPDLRWRISEEVARGMPAVQLGILTSAADFVRPGGTLVYATCSIWSAENEAVVSDFLSRRPDFVVTPLPDALPPALRSGPFLRTWPHRLGMDGFFGAVLSRNLPRSCSSSS